MAIVKGSFRGAVNKIINILKPIHPNFDFSSCVYNLSIQYLEHCSKLLYLIDKLKNSIGSMRTYCQSLLVTNQIAQAIITIDQFKVSSEHLWPAEVWMQAYVSTWYYSKEYRESPINITSIKTFLLSSKRYLLLAVRKNLNITNEIETHQYVTYHITIKARENNLNKAQACS